MKAEMHPEPPATWRMIVDVSAPMPGGLEDWPSEIADPILEAIEKQCKCRSGWEARVFFSGCFRDYDRVGGYFLDVQVGEFPTDATQRAWKEGRLR